jgi:uncharacterized protein YuzE
MSDESFPRSLQEGRTITVELVPDALVGSTKSVKLVLDLDEEGDVIGVEIIDLLLKVGRRGLDVIRGLLPVTGTGMRYGYDAQVDAFALHIGSARRSRDQKSVEGIIFLDANGAITGLQAAW